MADDALNGSAPAAAVAEKPKVTPESIRAGFDAPPTDAAPAAKETPAPEPAAPAPQTQGVSAAQARVQYLLQRAHEARMSGDNDAALAAMDELAGLAGLQAPPKPKPQTPDPAAQLREVRKQKLLALFGQGAGEGEDRAAIAQKQFDNYAELIGYHFDERIPQIAAATDELVRVRVLQILAEEGLSRDIVRNLTSKVEAEEWRFASDKYGPDVAAKIVPEAKARYEEARRAGVSWITPQMVADGIATKNKFAPAAPRSPASAVASGAPVNGNAGAALPGVSKEKPSPDSILSSFRALQSGAPDAPFKRFGRL